MGGHGLLERMLGDQLIVNGMLIVIAVCTLTFAYRHLRHVRGQRPSAHSRARRAPDTGRTPSPANPPGPAAVGGRWTGGDPWMSPPPRAAAGRPAPAGAAAHAEDYPSWPGRPGPGALHPDHPSWPGRPDPRWAVAEAAPAWDAGSVEVAAWILAEANAQATEIRHEARDE